MVQEITREEARHKDADQLRDEEIAELVALIRVNRERIERFEAAVEVAKDDLRRLLDERGSNWSDDEGYARLASEGTRRSYDASALDELILSEPQRYGWLTDYRKESVVPSWVQVK